MDWLSRLPGLDHAPRVQVVRARGGDILETTGGQAYMNTHAVDSPPRRNFFFLSLTLDFILRYFFFFFWISRILYHIGLFIYTYILNFIYIFFFFYIYSEFFIKLPFFFFFLYLFWILYLMSCFVLLFFFIYYNSSDCVFFFFS